MRRRNKKENYMAKLFGVNYEKEGKGVKKNEPQKKAFFKFFDIYFSNFWKFMAVGVLQLLFGCTVILNGFGNVGAAYIMRAATNEKHSFLLHDFFETIKKNWKQALVAGIFNVLFTALLVFDFYFFFIQKQNTFAIVGMALAMFLFVVFNGMKYYIWQLIITFDFKITKIYKNAFRLFFIKPFRNMLIQLLFGVCYALPALLFYFKIIPDTIMVGIYVLSAMLFFPGFRAFLITFNSFRVIRKIMIDPYYAAHPVADLEKREALGILEHTRTEDETIFEDRG